MGWENAYFYRPPSPPVKDPGMNASPFPVRWPPGYRRLAESLGPGSPLLRMGEPSPDEGRPDPDALPDPTGDRRLRPLPFLVRKHPDRALVLASGRCFFYCRFCFRRADPLHRGLAPSRADWDRIASWLRDHPEVREVILSGGDPLTLPDRSLARIARLLRTIPHLRGWRIHTRAPVVLPRRVTPRLFASIRGELPVRVVIHADHPTEIRAGVREAVQGFLQAGIPVENQAVLLRGVNDRPGVLGLLFRRLQEIGVGLRYLHHPDRAPGNGPFRVSIRQGLAAYREAARAIPDPPPYVVDLPNGAGKAPVEDLIPVAREARGTRTRTRYRWVRPGDWSAVVPDDRFEWWDVWEDGRNQPPGDREQACSGTFPNHRLKYTPRKDER